MSEIASLNVDTYMVGPLQNNTYLIWDPDTRSAVLVDPGMESREVADHIREKNLRLKAILNTHGHFDHIYENAFFKKTFGCPLRIHEGDLDFLRRMDEHALGLGFQAQASPEPDSFLREGERIDVGSGWLEVLHTPGHSQGSVCFTGPGFVLSGDTIFAQSIGRTDLPGGDLETLLQSIRERILTLPEDTRVYPGHGPASEVGYERRHNPYLGDTFQAML